MSLYFYSADADMAHAQSRLMRLLRADGARLYPYPLISETGYHSEHDAIHLLHQLGQKYEPSYLKLK